eukprot:3412208-Pleurochrysis_carterae.AAC.1
MERRARRARRDARIRAARQARDDPAMGKHRVFRPRRATTFASPCRHACHAADRTCARHLPPESCSSNRDGEESKQRHCCMRSAGARLRPSPA